jgi:cell division septum initiation protein DivIVA
MSEIHVDVPVLLGRSIARLESRIDELEALAPESAGMLSAKYAALDEIDAIAVAAENVAAVTLSAAAVHLALAFRVFDKVMAEQLDEDELKTADRSFRKLAFSALGAIAQAGSVDLDDIGVRTIMSAAADPWRH